LAYRLPFFIIAFSLWWSFAAWSATARFVTWFAQPGRSDRHCFSKAPRSPERGTDLGSRAVRYNNLLDRYRYDELTSPATAKRGMEARHGSDR
jgi:hypothetical protein